MQVIEALTVDLSTRVLREAPGGLPSVVSVLPAAYHMQALHCFFPSLSADNSITLDFNEQNTAASISILAALATLPRLSYVALSNVP